MILEQILNQRLEINVKREACSVGVSRGVLSMQAKTHLLNECATRFAHFPYTNLEFALEFLNLSLKNNYGSCKVVNKGIASVSLAVTSASRAR